MGLDMTLGCGIARRIFYAVDPSEASWQTTIAFPEIYLGEGRAAGTREYCDGGEQYLHVHGILPFYLLVEVSVPLAINLTSALLCS
jgi:hypothetical protein